MKIENYFDSISKNYTQMLSFPPLSILKRHEIKKVIELLDPTDNEKILDIGCGTGTYSKIIMGMGSNPSCIDISDSMLKIAREEGIECRKGDVESISLNRKYDKILCSGVLEFTDSPEKAIQNISEHLKRKGSLIVLFSKKSVFGYIYKLYHLTHGIEIKLLNIEKVVDMAARYGLEVMEIHKIVGFSVIIKFLKS